MTGGGRGFIKMTSFKLYNFREKEKSRENDQLLYFKTKNLLNCKQPKLLLRMRLYGQQYTVEYTVYIVILYAVRVQCTLYTVH